MVLEAQCWRRLRKQAEKRPGEPEGSERPTSVEPAVRSLVPGREQRKNERATCRRLQLRAASTASASDMQRRFLCLHTVRTRPLRHAAEESSSM